MKLSGYTAVTKPDTGESVWFGPADEVPGWAIDLITNPSAWQEEVVPVAPNEVVDEYEQSDAQVPEQVPPKVPPVKGKGSGAAAWAEYALAHGFSTEEDAKASEIREALAEAGIAVE